MEVKIELNNLSNKIRTIKKPLLCKTILVYLWVLYILRGQAYSSPIVEEAKNYSLHISHQPYFRSVFSEIFSICVLIMSDSVQFVLESVQNHVQI